MHACSYGGENALVLRAVFRARHEFCCLVGVFQKLLKTVTRNKSSVSGICVPVFWANLLATPLTNCARSKLTLLVLYTAAWLHIYVSIAWILFFYWHHCFFFLPSAAGWKSLRVYAFSFQYNLNVKKRCKAFRFPCFRRIHGAITTNLTWFNSVNLTKKRVPPENAFKKFLQSDVTETRQAELLA